MTRFSGLRTRLILLVLFALIPALGMITYTAWEQRRLAVMEAKQEALRLARLVALDHQHWIDGARQLLGTLAQVPVVRQGDGAACSAFLAGVLKENPRYANLGVSLLNGEVICSALPFTPPVTIADRLYFRRAVETHAFAVGEYQIGRITRKASVNFGSPLLDPKGRLQGVVFAALDLAWLRQLPLYARLPQGSMLTVVDRNGLILLRSGDSEKWVGRVAPETGVIRAIQAQGEGVVEASEIDGVPRLYGFTPLSGAPEVVAVYVSIGFPKAAVLADADRIFTLNLLGLALVGVLALLATRVGGDWFVLRHVFALVGATKRVATGDLSARTGVPYEQGELGELARAFDDMAAALETRATELQRQREALYQSEKLAAMGQLLAGVAHELNNPLSVVIGRASLLRQRFEGGPIAEQAEKIGQAAERCARIVKNFLALARQRPPERGEVRLNQVVQEAVELLAYPLRVDNIEVQFDLAEDLPVLWADPHQLHQVVVNLVSNAHDAMRQIAGHRRLRLTTRHDPQRGWIRLEVADSGPGIPPELRTRIFEPFFTTKPVGKGTGLGLSLCQGIVEGHGGSLWAESRPGQGAVFVVELPVQAPPEVGPQPVGVEVQPPVQGRRILVVDDEPEVAGTLADILAADGHEVETASNGAEALARLREGTYDLILTDLRMPELDGPGLYRELGRRHPDLLHRVVFLTGDVLSPEISAFLEQAGAPTVGKPFALEEVRSVVQRVLQEGSRGSR